MGKKSYSLVLKSLIKLLAGEVYINTFIIIAQNPTVSTVFAIKWITTNNKASTIQIYKEYPINDPKRFSKNLYKCNITRIKLTPNPIPLHIIIDHQSSSPPTPKPIHNKQFKRIEKRRSMGIFSILSFF